MPVNGAFVVGARVDVLRRVARQRYLEDTTRPSRQQRPQPLVAAQRVHLRLQFTGDKDRVPGDGPPGGVPVNRARDRPIPGGKRGSNAVNDGSRHARLIAKQHRQRRSARVHTAHTQAQRAAQAGSGVGIDDDSDAFPGRKGQGSLDFVGTGPEDEDDFVQTRGNGRVDDVLQEGLAGERQQLFRPPHARRRAGGENHTRNKHYRSPTGLAGLR
jgi:hypothetical protein